MIKAIIAVVATFLAGEGAPPSVATGYITHATMLFNLGGLLGTDLTVSGARVSNHRVGPDVIDTRKPTSPSVFLVLSR